MVSGPHSPLQPSGAAIWRHCPMWVLMNQLYPQDDTPATLEGNAAHWAFSEPLCGRGVAVGQVAPNGHVITDEMIDGADLIRHVVASRIPAGTPLYVEQTIPIPSVHAQCFGTPDVWGHIAATHTVELVDYKFGHRFVDEYENNQGACYTSGIIDMLAQSLNTPASILDQSLRVNFTIIQPRCYYRGAPVRTWSFVASDIRGQVNILAAAAKEALKPQPVAVTNPGCGDCPGRAVCPALQKAAYSDAEFSANSGIVQLTPAAASLELRMLERAAERLAARIDGLQETVKTHIRQGQPVPWQRAEQGYGRSQWTVPAEQVIALGSLYGANLSKPGCKTPNQAKALGVDESVIKAYSITPPGSIKLVPNN